MTTRVFKPVTRFPLRAVGPADRMAGFMAHLRLNGLKVGVEETGMALAALATVAVNDVDEARMAMKAVLTGSADDFARFDDLFMAYWHNRGRERAGQAQTKSGSGAKGGLALDHSQTDGAGKADRPDSDTTGEAEQSGEGRRVGSRITNLMSVDLRHVLDPADRTEAEAVAARLARAIRDRRSRRHKADDKGHRLDMRRILRASLSTGGEPIRLFRRARPERPARLVVLLDVSGSMTVYAPVYLAFVKGLMTADATTDAYLFHTRLVRITEALRDHDSLRAVNRLSLLAQGFGGGTRIGGNLAAFNHSYGKRLVSGRSLVVIISDGFDTDPPAVIGAELARLKKRGCRIIWLNPLKGWRDYQPVAAGMAAALPHLDMFAAANTLQSLAALEPELARI
jgi:uncharacterized protein